jgi:hypothetical protein
MKLIPRSNRLPFGCVAFSYFVGSEILYRLTVGHYIMGDNDIRLLRDYRFYLEAAHTGSWRGLWGG